MQTRIYEVQVKHSETSITFSLVRAANPSQAIRHVMRGMASAEVADQETLVRLIGKGIPVEKAGADE